MATPFKALAALTILDGRHAREPDAFKPRRVDGAWPDGPQSGSPSQ
jgi:hypothetical protein